jgi:predicted HTH transcriptional regulator
VSGDGFAVSGEPYFQILFSALNAHHDKGIKGISNDIAERLAELLGVSSRTIQTDLSVLTKAGVIAREGEDNGGEWRLLP